MSRIRRAAESDFLKMSRNSILTYERFVFKDYDELGTRLAYDYLRSEQFEKRLSDAYDWLIIEDEQNRMAGFCEIRGLSHISVFVIFDEFSGRGYGKQLLKEVCSKIKEGGSEGATLKSSRYAFEFYKKFGFVDTAEERIEHGICFVPMLYTF